MTTARVPSSSLPGWPRWLSEELAAAYVGLGREAFRQEVKAGVWPEARHGGVGGGRRLWDRQQLDAASDRLSNPTLQAKKRMREALGNENRVDTVSS